MSVSQTSLVSQNELPDIPHFVMPHSKKIALAISIIFFVGGCLSCYLGVAGIFSSPVNLSLSILGGEFIFISPWILRYALKKPQLPGYYPDLIRGLRIRLVRRELNERPLFHLDSLVNALGSLDSTPQMSVKFLDDNFEALPGGDTGGPSRDYLDDLFKGILGNSILTSETIDTSLLKFPTVPNPEHDSYEVCEKIGQLVMLLHKMNTAVRENNKKLTIGLHFDPSLFKIAFSFDEQEIRNDFSSFSFEKKIAMAQTLNQVLSAPAHVNLLELLSQPEWDHESIRGAYTYVNFVGELPSHLEDVGSVEIADNPQYLADLRESLKGVFLQYFESKLIAAHAVARGMGHVLTGHDSEDWETFRQRDHADFSASLQGTIDRESVANSIHYTGSNEVVEQKVEWIKQWIEEASDKDIQDFLKYTTGSSGLTNGRVIEINDYVLLVPHPFPKVHSCGSLILLSKSYSEFEEMSDNTKEGFLECFKTVVLGESSGYTGL